MLFLLELYEATRETRYLDTAQQGLSWVCGTLWKSTAREALPPTFYTGTMGIVYTLVRFSFTTGDLSLLSFSIPAYQWKHPSLDQSKTKSIRVWYVVVATEGEGNDRLLTGILTGEARQVLNRRMEADNIEQMEPIKFTPRHVCGGILHQEAIKERRTRLRARTRNAAKRRA